MVRVASKSVYVAGKWEEKTAVNHLQYLLREAGHTITFDWTVWETSMGLQEGAIRDQEGVSSCSAFVGLFTKDLRYKGALVEMGIAIGCGIPVYLVGDAIDSCIFIHHPLVTKCENVEELMKVIDKETEE